VPARGATNGGHGDESALWPACSRATSSPTSRRVDLDPQLRLYERLQDQQRVRRILALRVVCAEVLLARRVEAGDVVRVDQIHHEAHDIP
jgi:hypothetical protein